MTNHFDAALELQLDLLRTDASIRRDVLALLRKMEKELIGEIASARYTEWGRARVTRQLTEVKAAIQSYYNKAADIAIDGTEAIASVTAMVTGRAISVTVDAVLPSDAVLATLVRNSLVQGAAQGAWWSKQSADTSFRFGQAIRTGVAQSQTNAQMISTVRAFLDTSRANAAALVQTSVATIANDSRQAVFDANQDIIKRYRAVATLDVHTCWSADSTVLMADGSQRRIADIVAGDMVIGGVSGEQRAVLRTWRKVVESSVAIMYNGTLIGMATHDHQVLTKSGWKEIGSISLSSDVSERQVLCRSFVKTKEEASGAHDSCGWGGELRAAQCDQEIRRASHDYFRLLRDTRRSLLERISIYFRDWSQVPAWLQHDGWSGGSRRTVGGIIAEAGRKVLKAIQNGFGIQQKDARYDAEDGASAFRKAEGVLGVGSWAEKTAREVGIDVARKCFTLATSANYSGVECKKESDRSGIVAVEGSQGQGQRSAGMCAGRTAANKSGVGCCEIREDGGCNESEMERPCIYCEDGGTKTACTHPGSASEVCRWAEEHTGSEIGRKEFVSVGEISGREMVGEIEVYNITVEGDPTYVVGGVIAHNCPTCQPLDGLEWTKAENAIGHKFPFPHYPLHFSCRCLLVPIVLDGPQGGTRASDGGQVDADLTFEGWLKRQSKEKQTDILGKGRAELWRRGTITLADLVRGDGSPLTLAQLKSKYS